MTMRELQLGQVADFINGLAFTPQDWGEQGTQIIRIQNLTDPVKPYNRTLRHVPEKYRVRPGDLLVSWSASLGVFEWVGPEQAFVNQHIFRVVPREDIVDKRYLRYALEAALTKMGHHLHGSTMQHVNRVEFLETRLAFPERDEQRRIAAILDQADDLRRKRRLAVEKLSALPQAIFQEMFGDPIANLKGWPRLPLRDLIELHGGWSPVCLDRSAGSEEWGVLKLSAITTCAYDDTENKALPLGTQQRVALEVKPGDILFSRKNTYQLVGACAYVGTTREKLTIPDLMFRLRPRQDSDAIVGRYLHALLITPPKRRQIRALAGGSAGSMPNVSMGRLSAIDIDVPPTSLQLQFAELVESIESSRMSSMEHIAKLDELFASLQHRAFAGILEPVGAEAMLASV